jgi:hypothetical protein
MFRFIIGVETPLQVFFSHHSFIYSFQRLRKRKSLIDPDGRYFMMDSGAFSEISKNGKYTFTIDEYLSTVEKFNPDSFVNMDFMCEPMILRMTGLTVKDHQKLTIENHIKIKEKLRDYNIKSEFIGVLQGWKLED